mmetsp:Transcript_22645/g.52839  ORF Transcript_22645/g.52839 Transcript_22645/m.52839 type:complete len:665 (-) Transcript_22645:187-2181(-)|eukprot:CAMPEP_0178396226 /NCGR_PEP_ID=MMETSP0689_2-20121128/13622_1 /TAXON_ID=160604 /ORGANISM="Amphidinium massartii, Strain CS-259" /LENGTH=664 /DNA_ID=CAMNT_0020016899 /DNA_START=44 /DNA_END=2038 /DNA_ORIENTATION=+
MAEEAEQPATRLFHTLAATFAAILLGSLLIRFKLVQTEGLKGMGFFVGQIAFPLLMFNTVATAQLSMLDVRVVCACSGAKAVVMALAFFMTLVAFKTERPFGQRLLSATVFSFLAIASNDFAIGFPVVQALYDPKLNMNVYITANALVGSFIFTPLVIVLLSYGETLTLGKDDPEKASRNAGCSVLLGVVLQILTNPVITFTLLGMAFKAAFGGTLVEEGGMLRLPSPLYEIVQLFTSPFAMLALFLTGTSLQNPRITVWPSLMVLLKVLICPFLSVLLVYWYGISGDLKNFSFFYGSIPASSAPLVLAGQYDPENVELVASAILFGLILAGPIMFTTALFLSTMEGLIPVIAVIQFACTAASVVAGVVLIGLLIFMGRSYGAAYCTGRQILLAYSCIVLGYELLMLYLSPQVNDLPCHEYIKSRWSVIARAVCWFQNVARLLMLCLMYFQATYWPGTDMNVGPRKRTNAGACVLFGCCAAGLLPGLLLFPNTVNEICASVGPLEYKVDLLPNMIWSCVLLVTACSFAVLPICRGSRVEDEYSAVFSAGETPPSGPWMQREPRHVVTSLSILFIVRCLMQVVNTSQVIASENSLLREGMLQGSFAQMLVLENMLEHLQMVALLVFLICDTAFEGELRQLVAKKCICFSSSLVETKHWSMFAASH